MFDCGISEADKFITVKKSCAGIRKENDPHLWHVIGRDNTLAQSHAEDLGHWVYAGPECPASKNAGKRKTLQKTIVIPK